MFEKTLASLIQGLRDSSGNEEEYISGCLQEIRVELGSVSSSVKCMSLLKLWYLQILGYDMQWATFAIVEIMSNSKFSLKRPGYSSCAVTFNDNTDVALLTTNLFRKDFASREMYEAGLALSCLACMCTREMSQDIHAEVTLLLTSSKQYLRKKAALCCFRIFTKNPSALTSSFPRLRERLSDESPGVLATTINTMFELARKAPQHYLGLVPQLYHILVNNNSNWLTIKILKFFALLCPYEERLPRKLQEPLGELLRVAKAKSIEYEIICLILSFLSVSSDIVGTALERLAGVINSSDRNLRYLGLVLLSEIISRPSMISRVENHECFPNFHEKILAFVEDNDESVRPVALKMLHEIAVPASFRNIAEILLEFNRRQPSKSEFLLNLLSLGALNRYALVEDFEWYLMVLADIASCKQTAVAEGVSRQLVDIAVRVPAVRGNAVELSCVLIDAFSQPTSPAGDRFSKDFSRSSFSSRSAPSSLVTGAAAWILGEYKEHIDFSASRGSGFAYTDICSTLIRQALDRRSNRPAVRQICIWSAAKIFLHGLSVTKLSEEKFTVLNQLLAGLKSLSQSTCVEVSERAAFAHHVLNYFEGDSAAISSWSSWKPKDLVPVHSDAQSQVLIPENLHLDTPFFSFSICDSEDLAQNGIERAAHDGSENNAPSKYSKSGRISGKKFNVLRDEIMPDSISSLGGPTANFNDLELASISDKQMRDLEGRRWHLALQNDHLRLFYSVRHQLIPPSPDVPVTLRVDLRAENCRPEIGNLQDIEIAFEALQHQSLLTKELGDKWNTTAIYLDCTRWMPSSSLSGSSNLHLDGKITYIPPSATGSGKTSVAQSDDIIVILPVTKCLQSLRVNEEQMVSLMELCGDELKEKSTLKETLVPSNAGSIVSISVNNVHTRTQLSPACILYFLQISASCCNMFLLPQTPLPQPVDKPISQNLKCLMVSEMRTVDRSFDMDSAGHDWSLTDASRLVVAFVSCSLASMDLQKLTFKINVRSCSTQLSHDVARELASALREAVCGSLHVFF